MKKNQKQKTRRVRQINNKTKRRSPGKLFKPVQCSPNPKKMDFTCFLVRMDYYYPSVADFSLVLGLFLFCMKRDKSKKRTETIDSFLYFVIL